MIDDDDIINLIVEDYTHNKSKNFIIQDYEFNDITINIELTKHPNWNTFIFRFWILNYLDKSFEYETILLNIIEDEKEVLKNINNIVAFLLHDFRDTYCYSKLLDEIHPKKLVKEKERLTIAYIKLCKNKLPDTCCVCMEYNKVLTKCNHNVCRICYKNLKTIYTDTCYEDELECKECPLCRRPI